MGTGCSARFYRVAATGASDESIVGSKPIASGRPTPLAAVGGADAAL
jgi:hypothetical protein